MGLSTIISLLLILAQLLAPRETLTVFINNPKQGRPIETTLKNFSCRLSPIELAPKCMIMTEWNDTSNLIVGNTPSKDLVRKVLKQVRVIRNKEFHKVQESISIILILALRNPTRH